MGFLGDLFGDESERDRMMQEAMSRFESQMSGFVQNYQTMMGASFNYLAGQRDSDIDAYTSMFQSNVDSYRSSLREAREGLLASFAEQRELIGQGFDASREEIRQGVQAQRAQTMAANAFTGLGNTSFGQSAVNAVERRGALDLGLLSERERMMMSDLVGGQAASLYNADAQVGANILNAGTTMAQTVGSMNQAYTMAQYGGMSNMAGNIFSGQTNMAQNSLGIGLDRAANVGSGFNLGPVLFGAGLGAVAGYLGGPGAGMGASGGAMAAGGSSGG
jgi:hypothetical protein